MNTLRYGSDPLDAGVVPTGTIHSLLLDSSGVLFDQTAWRRWLFGLLARLGMHSHYASFYRVWDREFQPEVWRGRCEFWTALRRFLHASGLSQPQVDEILASTRAKRRILDQDVRAFPGVTATLARLRRSGVGLAVVSRAPCDPAEIRLQLARLGLAGLLTDFLATKDPRYLDDPTGFFAWALAQRDSRPHEVAYVGRDPADLVGAAEAGMLTIAFNYEADAAADLYLDQFDQLPELLGRRPLLLAG